MPPSELQLQPPVPLPVASPAAAAAAGLPPGATALRTSTLSLSLTSSSSSSSAVRLLANLSTTVAYAQGSTLAQAMAAELSATQWRAAALRGLNMSTNLLAEDSGGSNLASWLQLSASASSASSQWREGLSVLQGIFGATPAASAATPPVLTEACLLCYCLSLQGGATAATASVPARDSVACSSPAAAGLAVSTGAPVDSLFALPSGSSSPVGGGASSGGGGVSETAVAAAAAAAAAAVSAGLSQAAIAGTAVGVLALALLLLAVGLALRQRHWWCSGSSKGSFKLTFTSPLSSHPVVAAEVAAAAAAAASGAKSPSSPSTLPPPDSPTSLPSSPPSPQCAIAIPPELLSHSYAATLPQVASMGLLPMVLPPKPPSLFSPPSAQ